MTKIYQKTFPGQKNAGFTLIELLVVVLIVGILAAVALPQYTKAVEKGRMASVLPILDAVYKSQESYYMANGVYADTLDKLDLDIPWTQTNTCFGMCSVIQGMGWKTTNYTNGEWYLIIGIGNPSAAVFLFRKTYSGAAMSKFMVSMSSRVNPGTLYCLERSDKFDSNDFNSGRNNNE